MTSEDTPPKAAGVGMWHFLSLVVIVAAGSALVWASFEVFAANENGDRALAIIGAVLPSVVAIGGAIFGVSAFKAGTTSGAEAGEAKAAVAEGERDQLRTKSVAAIDLALAELDNAQVPADQPRAAGGTTPNARDRLFQLRAELDG